MAVLQKYIDIAFADITDFVEFGREEVPVMAMFGPVIDKETKKPLTKMINTVKFKQSTDVDGTIISEVSQGKDGIKIKLSDKMKALEKLEKYLDLLPDHHKRRMEEEKLKIEQQRIELEKIKAGPKDENTEEWISALQEVAAKRRAKVTANE
jgi:Terminase small subunit.